MPPQTYLPTGMEGVITCPAASQPPLIRVDWTKDGEPLDLSTVIIQYFVHTGAAAWTPLVKMNNVICKQSKAIDETSAF